MCRFHFRTQVSTAPITLEIRLFPETSSKSAGPIIISAIIMLMLLVSVNKTLHLYAVAIAR